MKKFRSQIYTYINNLNMGRKISLTFLLISLIPLCILGIFSYTATKTLLINQQTADMESRLIQTNQMLNTQLDLYDKIVRSLTFNKRLISTTNINFTSNYDIYEYVKFIDELFIMTRNLTTGIDRITFYTNSNITNHGKTVLTIEDARDTEWYRNASATDTTWHYTENHLLCVRPVVGSTISTPRSNYIVMWIDLDTIQTTLDSLDKNNTRAVITNPDNKIILTNDSTPLSEDVLQEIAHKKTTILKKPDLISMKGSIQYTDWNLMIYSSYQDILTSTFFLSVILILIILLCFILVLIIGQIFSHLLVHRIRMLQKNIHEIEKGRLEVTVTNNSNDEIGELIDGFTNMVNRINELIEINYVTTIAKKEYELKALQAQINPHFLYNSLSLINWRALRLHAMEISEMAQLLSRFYRTTLNNGNDITTVENELLNVKSYLQIQLIMHNHDFDIEYQIEDGLSAYTMPNLMLQPLVENSILHGLENKEERGSLVLSCIKKEDCLVFTVRDNGAGIEPELLDSILESPTSGYGLKNVNQRAKLQYGEEYGLSIESTVNVGTTVTLKIPIRTADT